MVLSADFADFTDCRGKQALKVDAAYKILICEVNAYWV